VKSRWRPPVVAGVSLAVAALLIFMLRGRHHEFATATSRATPAVLAIAVFAQILALLARSEAWHLSIREAGGSISRRVLYRASSMQVLGSLLNGQLGVAARIAALRRSSGTQRCPQVSTLIAAEFPILAVEAVLAGLASFTLIGPLGLPWWSPALGFAVVAAAAAGLRRLALRTGHGLWRGLAVLRSQRHGFRMVAFVVVAILSQVARNWLLLNAVGMHASLFDAVAVLIAVVALAQLPVGPSVGAAAAVLILGTQGVAGAAAAGVLMTVTGTVGGMCFALWAGVDRFVGDARRLRGRANAQRVVVLDPAPAITRRDL
jgi:uncharacterized membrane protein YbhN (UPF0104 family)